MMEEEKPLAKRSPSHEEVAFRPIRSKLKYAVYDRLTSGESAIYVKLAQPETSKIFYNFVVLNCSTATTNTSILIVSHTHIDRVTTLGHYINLSWNINGSVRMDGYLNAHICYLPDARQIFFHTGIYERSYEKKEQWYANDIFFPRNLPAHPTQGIQPHPSHLSFLGDALRNGSIDKRAMNSLQQKMDQRSRRANPDRVQRNLITYTPRIFDSLLPRNPKDLSSFIKPI